MFEASTSPLKSDTPRPTLTFSNSPNQELFADPLTEVLRNGAPRFWSRPSRPMCKDECTDEVCPLAARPRRE